jgi:hypothetical protein
VRTVNYHKTQSETRTIESWINLGWVEYLSRESRISWAENIGLEEFKKVDLHDVAQYVIDQDVMRLGLISMLCHERLKYPFSLPVFFHQDQVGKLTITCGKNRVQANKLCGILDSGPSVIISDPQAPLIGHVLETSHEFDTIFNLQNTDYDLVFNEQGRKRLSVIQSVLKHTPYSESSSEEIELQGKRCLSFWNRYVENQQIKIKIYCKNQTRNKIQCYKTLKSGQKMFDIEWHDLDFDIFSYGRVLQEFHSNTVPDLKLWVYDIQDTLTLEDLIPWGHREYAISIPKNEKFVMFSTHAKTMINSIGNIVK